ncbi:hypothetical protein OPT61_g3363 [Boeremia exigua]|uniref:Uncharacterized protein n=1 Tax=Boeremia exigua TaxID=749465 RepID=A0ACC2II73_9PLEO|nr:hypothetical protein OPT61_g3363 [Boeremia exigua]
MAGAHDHGALPVKEALDRCALAGVWARRSLALAIAGTFCALASVAGGAGQAGVNYCGFWGGPLVRPGAWSGDEAKHGLITTPLIRLHGVPAIFLELEYLLGTTWLTRFSSATGAFTQQTERLSLSTARPGMSTRLGASLQIRWHPVVARYLVATFENSVLSGCEHGQAIGRELETKRRA